MFDQQVSKEDFIARYDKHKTQISVRSSLKAFEFYLEKKYPNVSEAHYFEELKKLDESQVYLELDRIVQFWKSNSRQGVALAPKTISLYFTFTRAWFRINGIRTFDDLIKQYVKMPKKLKEKSATMTHDMALKIHNAMQPKYAVFFDFICYSGLRLAGEGLNIEVRDIDLGSDPIKIRVRAEIAKTGVERTTFVPISMKVELAKLIASKGPTDKVFNFNYYAYYRHFEHVRKRLGLIDRKQNGRNYMINPYKARKYAKTNISMATDSDFSEHILGHENGVKGIYYEAEDSELAKMYKKAVPNIRFCKVDVG